MNDIAYEVSHRASDFCARSVSGRFAAQRCVRPMS